MIKLLKAIISLPIGKFFITQALINYCAMINTYTEKDYPKNSIIGLSLLKQTAEEVHTLILDFNRDMTLPIKKKRRAPKKYECDSMNTH